MLNKSAVGQLSSLSSNRYHFVLLDNDESCPTADLSNIDRPNGPAYSTGELLNTSLVVHGRESCAKKITNIIAMVMLFR